MSMAKILLAIIRGYQYLLSPWIGGQCRFEPTCSCYGQTAIARFGALRGGCLTVKRLARCQPFAKGGYDPVPEALSVKNNR